LAERAASSLANGPSFTSQISSTAAVPISALARAGSSTPGNCTSTSYFAPALPYCCTDFSARREASNADRGNGTRS
jgi:hypothetical protein